MTKPVTVTIRGEDAARLRARAKARNLTPEEVVLRLVANDERQSARLQAAWSDSKARAALSDALKAGWAKAKQTVPEPATTPEPTPEVSPNGNHA